MSEILLEFSEPVSLPGGLSHQARICGRQGSDGLWEGWIEFRVEGEGSDALASPIESRQPDRARLLYWATGLSYAYLQGALARALDRARSAASPAAEPPPAPRPSTVPANGSARARPNGTGAARAVLDPFEVFAQGEDVLRRELNALSADHLRNLIAAYDLGSDQHDAHAVTSSRAALAQVIVQAVSERVRASRQARQGRPGEARP